MGKKEQTRKVVNKIWEQIQENRKKLDSCKLHDFSIDLNPTDMANRRYRCTRCGGDVSAVNKLYYELGVKHGKATVKATV